MKTTNVMGLVLGSVLVHSLVAACSGPSQDALVGSAHADEQPPAPTVTEVKCGASGRATLEVPGLSAVELAARYVVLMPKVQSVDETPKAWGVVLPTVEDGAVAVDCAAPGLPIRFVAR